MKAIYCGIVIPGLTGNLLLMKMPRLQRVGILFVYEHSLYKVTISHSSSTYFFTLDEEDSIHPDKDHTLHRK